MLTVLRPAYGSIAPSSKVIGGSLLDKGFISLKNDVRNKIVKASNYHIITDGWTNIRNEHILNFVICVPNESPLFYKAIETKKESVTGKFHYEKVIEVATELGIDKLTSVVSDNCSSMQALYTLLEEAYPTKFGQGCAAHVMNLLIKDIAKVEEISNIKEVNYHAKLKAVYDEEKKKVRGVRSLQIPIVTRWHSLVDSCVRLFDARHVINDVFGAVEKNWVSKEIRDIADNPTFWNSLGKIIKILEYPLNLLTRFEADDCLIDEVYSGFLKLITHFEDDINTNPRLIKKDTLIELINKRWCFLNTEVHEYAFLLAPRNAKFFTEMPNDDYKRTIKNFKAYCKKYYPDEKTQNEAIQQFLQYLNDVVDDDEDYQINPMHYWTIYRSKKFNFIKEIALRILSIPVSSAAAERVWSVYGKVHSKFRGNLSNEKLEKLVFVRVNHRLAQKHITNDDSDSD